MFVCEINISVNQITVKLIFANFCLLPAKEAKVERSKSNTCAPKARGAGSEGRALYITEPTESLEHGGQRSTARKFNKEREGGRIGVKGRTFDGLFPVCVPPCSLYSLISSSLHDGSVCSAVLSGCLLGSVCPRQCVK